MSKVSAVRQAYEKKLKKVAGRFSPQKRRYLLAYARQLEAEMLGKDKKRKRVRKLVDAEQERWAKEIVAEELRPLLNKLAEEALVERRLGKLNRLVSRFKGDD